MTRRGSGNDRWREGKHVYRLPPYNITKLPTLVKILPGEAANLNDRVECPSP